MPETPEDDRMHPLDPCEQCAEAVMPEREPASTEEVSPLPWTWNENGDELLDANGKIVLAIGCGYDGLWGGEYPSEADMKFILDATSSFSSLDVSQVEALKLELEAKIRQEWPDPFSAFRLGYDSALMQFAHDLTALLRGGRPRQ